MEAHFGASLFVFDKWLTTSPRMHKGQHKKLANRNNQPHGPDGPPLYQQLLAAQQVEYQGRCPTASQQNAGGIVC